MNVLALDSGGHTGCAMRFNNGVWHTMVTKSPEELWDLLRQTQMDVNGEHIYWGRWDLVGYERFASSVGTSQPAIYTMELCGSIQGVCHVLGIPCKRFEPANRTAWMVKATEMLHERRKAEGRLLGPLIVHEIDALAHLLRYEEIGWDAKPKHHVWGTGLMGGGTGMRS